MQANNNNNNNGSARGGRLGYDEIAQKPTTRSRLLLSISSNTQLMMMMGLLPPPPGLLTQLFDDDDPVTAASEAKRWSCRFLQLHSRSVAQASDDTDASSLTIFSADMGGFKLGMMNRNLGPACHLIPLPLHLLLSES